MVLVRLFLLSLTLVAIGWIAPAPAEAQNPTGWQVCNRTSYVIDAAVGHTDPNGVIVEGWTKLQPGSCKIALPGPLEPGLHFLYGRSSSAHRGGAREWGGDTSLCIDPTGSFSIENPPSCEAMGLEPRTFRPVQITRRTRWTTTFTEIDDFNEERSRAAGVQRLLEDAGVYSGNIDGYLGRKTRAAIGDFLKANGLPGETSDEDLIDFLEQVAKQRARDVGFTLCNRTESRIWSAIARRGADGWESRGWWVLEAGGCARAIDAPLRGTDHYVYGEMEVEGTTSVRTLSRASDAFCVARAKFAIAGRDNCEASAYRTALFAATAAPENRKLVFEFWERDFAKASANE